MSQVPLVQSSVRQRIVPVSAALAAMLTLALAGCQTATTRMVKTGDAPRRSPSPAPAAPSAAPVIAAHEATGTPTQRAQAARISSSQTRPTPSEFTAPPEVQLVEFQAPLAEIWTEPALPEHHATEGHLALTPDPTCDCDSNLSCFEQWRPPNLPGPWPYDEYLCDGGDRALPVAVMQDWTVRGIDAEDAVAHYDTLSGETVVTPSNRVCIYAPRFAAVRHVTAPMLEQQRLQAAGVDLPLAVRSQDLNEGPNAVTQPVQVERSLAVVPPYAFFERIKAQGLDNVIVLRGIEFDLLPYEDLNIIRRGVMDASEKARLAELTTAAKTWETVVGVQVLINGQAANEAVRDVATQEVTHYEMPKGKPRLRIVKIANRQYAQPGDIVEFTLRYDNIGNEPIGNVTILDSLTPRLEYVPDTAQSTRDADFFTVDNEADSLILRWELKEPLKVGEGGIVRFQTRVR